MQLNENDCGKAVLKSLLEQKKLKVSYNKIFEGKKISTSGVSLYDIQNELKDYGIESSVYEVSDFEELQNVDFPFIAVTSKSQLSHFVLCHKVNSHNEMTISDPSMPDINKIQFNQFKEDFLGYILLVDNVNLLQQKDVSEKNENIDISYMIPLIKKIELVFVYAIKFFCPLVFYYIMQTLVSSFFLENWKGNEIIFVLFFAGYIGSTYLLNILEDSINTEVEILIQEKIISKYFSSLIKKQKNSTIKDSDLGFFWSIFENASSLIQRYFVKVNFACILVIVPILFLISKLLGIVFIIVFVFTIIILKKKIKSIINYRKYFINSSNNLSAVFEEYVGAIDDINQNLKQTEASTKFSTYVEHFMRSKYDSILMDSKIYGFVQSMTNLMLVIVLLICSVLVTYSVDITNIVTSLYVFILILSIFNKSLSSLVVYELGKASTEHITELKDFYIENDESPVDNEEKLLQIEIDSIKRFDLSDISFSYEKDNELIEHLDLSFKKGYISGISGGNGTGKTTIINLMQGLLSPDSGNFSINNTHLFRSFKGTDIAKYISLYSPNQHLFTGSLNDNITMSIFSDENEKSDNTNPHFSSNIPDYIFDSGKYISEGQKQKILIERCLHVQKDIYIFDEPTTNLDDTSIMEFINSINKLKEQDKIVIIISHLPQLLEACDTLFYLKKELKA